MDKKSSKINARDYGFRERRRVSKDKGGKV
jgi:hypothetical protein